MFPPRRSRSVARCGGSEQDGGKRSFVWFARVRPEKTRLGSRFSRVSALVCDASRGLPSTAAKRGAGEYTSIHKSGARDDRLSGGGGRSRSPVKVRSSAGLSVRS